MKVKHLLFSSIFLSMGFAACTNEVEEFAPQSQEKEFAGVELDDVTINLTNSDFSADVETRALLNKVEDNWIAEWEEGDAIGAAWFSKVKFDDEGKVTGTPVNVYDKFENQYGSNAKFNWKGGVKFEADAVVMAGGYVLYHPYNEAITDDMSDIPVQPIKSPLRFNCDPDSIANQVSENITAANVVKFLKGGDQLTDFTIEQIPNLYGLSFRIEDENLLKLESKLQISRIYVEATNGDAPAINTTGYIEPVNFNIDANTYNGVEGSDPLPEIDFVPGDAETKISRMEINVINKAKDANYQITALDNPTSRFYFSMLPTDEFNKLTIKIVGKMGKKTMVFSKEYNSAYSKWTELKELMQSEGNVILLPVKLNVAESVDDGIYDEEQFVEAWKAGQRNFNLASVLDLTTITDKKVNFTDAENNGHVIFSGEKVTLPTINGKYSFFNDVDIKGDATLERHAGCTDKVVVNNTEILASNVAGAGTTVNISGNLTLVGKQNMIFSNIVNVTGNLVNQSSVNFAKLNVGGNVNNEGDMAAGHYAKIKGDVTVKAGTLSSADLTVAKNLIIEAGATANVKVKKLDVTGNVTANAALNVENAGNAIAAIAGTLTAKAAVTIDKAKVNDVIADAPVTIKEVIQMGNVTANAAVTIEGAVAKMGNVDAKAKVTIAGVVTEMGSLTTFVGTPAEVSFGAAVNQIGNIIVAEESTVTFNGAVSAKDITTDVNLTFPAAAIAEDITINKGTVTAKSTLKANSITVADKHSELIAKSKNLTVSGTLTANGKVDAISSTKNGVCIGKLVIADGITVTLNGKSATEKCVIGNLDINKDMTYFGTLAGNYIAVNGGENEGTINVPSFTINEGTFAQKGTFTGAIAVAEGATLDVDANTNAAVTNNGTVNVAAGVSIIGAVENNNTIELAGILNEDNGAITLNEGSLVKMAEKANLKLTSTTPQKGEVNVCNNAIIDYSKKPAIVSYNWKTVAPKDYGTSLIKDKINKYYLDNATLKTPAFNLNATIEANGIITFGSDVDFKTNKNNITFIGDTKFTAAKAYNVALYSGNKVLEEKTLTVEKVVLTDGTITLGTNAKFVGEKGAAKITY